MFYEVWGGANIQAQVCHSSALFRMWLNSMSSALTPPYMIKELGCNVLQFLCAQDGFDVLEHAVAITVVDKSREKLAIAQLVLHQPAATKTLGKNCM
jgi:hypothetical protein